MRTLFRSVRSLVVTTLVGGVVVGLCLAALAPGVVEVVTAHHYTADTVTNLSALDQRTTVFDSAGNVMGYLGLQNREVVSYTQIPIQVVDAVIATEDRTFWTNDGIDLGAVFRAFVANVMSGRIEQGGSTITQQLVKNRILTPKRDVNR